MSADDLAKILDELGQRLGPTGEHVFALAVRQVYIDSAIGIIVAIVAAVSAVAGTRWLYRWAKADEGNYSDRDMVSVAFGIVICIFAGMAVLNGIFFALPQLLNPEYSALRDIIGTIKR